LGLAVQPYYGNRVHGQSFFIPFNRACMILHTGFFFFRLSSRQTCYKKAIFIMIMTVKIIYKRVRL